MTLSKKHYIAIANILKDHVYSMDTLQGTESIVEAFCTYFKTDNPNFDEDRFRKEIYGKEY